MDSTPIPQQAVDGLRPERRVTLSGLMAAIAATAGGLAFWRFDASGWIYQDYRFIELSDSSCVAALAPTAIVGVVGIGIVLRRSRPRGFPPGVAACLAATMACVVGLLSWSHNIIQCIPSGEQFNARVWRNALNFGAEPSRPAAAVLAIGLVLLLEGRRGEPTWIDRCGRLLGLFWVATALSRVVYAIFNLKF